ncbi:hypothetical protein EV174_004757 [Coemansia sp. RSA 2320]|nr:hypothetical protein EV174_004757 [Coemansia sp. RSA 2320]
MALTLQTLPRQIVDQILDRCYDRQLPAFHPKFFRVYQDFQDYSHLCRRLRDSALPFLTRRLIFERYNLAVEGVGKQTLSHEDLKAAKRLPPVIRWKTNMPRVVGRLALGAAVEGVTEVIISTYDRYPDPEDVLAILRQYQFDQYTWPNVTSLCVNFKSDFDVDDREADDPALTPADPTTTANPTAPTTPAPAPAPAASTADWISNESFTALSQFLALHMPAVDTLWMDDNRCRRVGQRNAMSTYIADRLDRFRRLNLRFAYMPAFGVKTLPPIITHLTLSVHSAYDYIDIPRIMTPMLVSLTLNAIPLNYLWDRFCHSTSVSRSATTNQILNTVEFTELRRLELSFHVPYRSVPSGKSEDDLMWEKYHKNSADSADSLTNTSYKGNPKLKTISVKERTAKYTVLRTDGKRPKFPKLQHLALNMYPGRISDFLLDIPIAQLLTLRISGDLVAFKGVRLTGFTSLQTSNVSYFSDSRFRESAHGNRFLCKAFAQPPTVRSLSVTTCSKCRLRLPPASAITCTSIRRLCITAQVSYADLPDLLRRLPALEYLDLQRALFVDPPPLTHTPEGMARHLLSTDMRPVSTSLIKFVPDVLCRNATDEVVFYNIFMLIARTPSLRELKMFSFYSTQFFRELLPLFKIPELFRFIRHLATLDCNE